MLVLHPSMNVLARVCAWVIQSERAVSLLWARKYIYISSFSGRADGIGDGPTLIVCLLLVVTFPIQLQPQRSVLSKCSGVLTRNLLSASISRLSTGTWVTQSIWKYLSHTTKVSIQSIFRSETSARRFFKWKKTCQKLSSLSAKWVIVELARKEQKYSPRIV